MRPLRPLKSNVRAAGEELGQMNGFVREEGNGVEEHKLVGSL